ncbi:hypothetical protein V6C03_08365 [Methyloligella sp. 2.7D]|uniref:hypothetical protein n=1 Tax=unclassified Methyloligella TaxID=2625955 RepID=UPI00157DE407|nr:hypothetical protein [Methyloligella sp. GL2]QKP78116.1 hypothetical protein HT051_12085 [Methyloligella sp. GL2]
MEKPLLLIGVHRDELAFGEHVAALLEGRCDILRVEQGLDNDNPTPDEQFHYRIRHAEMYHQVLQNIGRRTGPVIDIHSGLNARGRCADIYCHDERFLACAEAAVAPQTERAGAFKDVRLVQIVAHDAPERELSASVALRPVVWTYIPHVVWQNPHFLYIGIEVFLASRGAGTPQDHAYGRDLVLLSADCASRSSRDAARVKTGV